MEGILQQASIIMYFFLLKIILLYFFPVSISMNKVIQGFQGVILYRAESRSTKGHSFITGADLISTSSLRSLHGT